MCSEDDIKRLEEELEGKQPEEQWKTWLRCTVLSEEQEQERQDPGGVEPDQGGSRGRSLT